MGLDRWFGGRVFNWMKDFLFGFRLVGTRLKWHTSRRCVKPAAFHHYNQWHLLYDTGRSLLMDHGAFWKRGRKHGAQENKFSVEKSSIVF